MSAQKPLIVQASPVGEVCIANISPMERRKRLNIGLFTFAVALVILAVLMVSGADRLWRLPLLPVFWGATIGYFQWRDKTCIGLAKMNARHTGEEKEMIEDAAELAQIQRQARRVQIKALIAAIPLTLIALLLPVPG